MPQEITNENFGKCW